MPSTYTATVAADSLLVASSNDVASSIGPSRSRGARATATSTSSSSALSCSSSSSSSSSNSDGGVGGGVPDTLPTHHSNSACSNVDDHETDGVLSSNKGKLHVFECY